jgi:2-dehydro-3-deoxygluconokinase
MPGFLSVGECMLELSGAGGPDLWRMGIAGDTLNTAWYVRARLGPDWQVNYLTRLGRDRFSDRIARFLDENGIGTGWITRDPQRMPGLYAIDLQDGERSFTYWRGQSAARGLADDAAHLARAFDEAAAIYLSGITLAILAPDRRAAVIDALAAARARGALTAFDPNLRPRLWEDAATMCACVTQAAGAAALCLPSLDDEVAAFGDAGPEATAARYLRAGAAAVVVKTGGGPVVLADASGSRVIDGLPRVVPVDTTGAGDSFNGGYLAARLSGLDEVQAVRAAHALASRVVLHPGALIPMATARLP